MNYDELNEYIKHYIEKDKTKSAIMLDRGLGYRKKLLYPQCFRTVFEEERQAPLRHCFLIWFEKHLRNKQTHLF